MAQKLWQVCVFVWGKEVMWQGVRRGDCEWGQAASQADAVKVH